MNETSQFVCDCDEKKCQRMAVIGTSPDKSRVVVNVMDQYNDHAVWLYPLDALVFAREVIRMATKCLEENYGNV